MSFLFSDNEKIVKRIHLINSHIVSFRFRVDLCDKGVNIDISLKPLPRTALVVFKAIINFIDHLGMSIYAIKLDVNTKENELQTNWLQIKSLSEVL